MTNDGDGVSVKCFSTAGIYYDIYIYIQKWPISMLNVE